MAQWIVREERVRSKIVEAETAEEAENLAQTQVPRGWTDWDETIEAEEYEG